MMMTLVNMDSKGLVVLPTHRVVFGLAAFDESKLVSPICRNTSKSRSSIERAICPLR